MTASDRDLAAEIQHSIQLLDPDAERAGGLHGGRCHRRLAVRDHVRFVRPLQQILHHGVMLVRERCFPAHGTDDELPHCIDRIEETRDASR